MLLQMKNLSLKNVAHKWIDEHIAIRLPYAYFLSELCAEFFMF